MNPFVVAVSRSGQHTFSKPNKKVIKLIEAFGVEGDAHAGKTVTHLFLKKKDPTRPNIRQVHLIQAELFDELIHDGFSVNPGQLGENITTRGVDLLALPTGTRLSIGPDAVVEVTALRNPCVQIDNFQEGLLKAVLDHDEKGNPIRKSGVMGVVLKGGEIRPDDTITVELPAEPRQRLAYIW